SDNFIGDGAGFGANGVSMNIQSGTYGGYQILDNRGLSTNTTPGFIELGTVLAGEQKNVANNMGALVAGSGSGISADVSIATTPGTVIASMPIPANALRVGDTFRITAYGRCTTTGSTTVRLHFGTAGTTADTALFGATPPLVASTTTLAGIAFDALVTVRSIGASGGIMANAVLQALPITTGAATGLSARTIQNTSVTVNTTVDSFLTLSGFRSAGVIVFYNANIAVI
ncbi:MAG: hypothetical protein AAB834_03905, partial [Patescibacteria group bacterium]